MSMRRTCLLILAALAGFSGGLPGPRAWAAGSEPPPSRRAPEPLADARSQPSGFEASRYTPAVLWLSFNSGAASPASATPTASAASPAAASFLDLTLVAPEGEPIGKRVPVNQAEFSTLLRALYSQLSRQQSLDVGNAASPSRVLYSLLIAPMAADLQRLGVTTLLVAADPGLQAVPLAALHDGAQYFGERYAFSLTPSIGLTSLTVPETAADARQLCAGSSRFEGLAPLPLVPQEISRISGEKGETYFDQAFTPSVLLQKVADTKVARAHVATHAEFLPGGPSQSRLFTGTGSIPLDRFAEMRQRRRGQPIDLIALSACRTALGDRDSELGFAGLALQAGARSAIGTLWYVDDVATSAFFVQFYRYLDQGLPKAEALQATRLAMARGQIRLEGERVLGPDGRPLLEQLSATQQRRVRDGLDHPFFWSGISLLGAPW